MLSVMSPRQRIYLAVVVVLTALAAVLEYSGQADLAIFIVAGAALSGLAWLVSFSTEAIGERLSPGATGVLQATLGNLTELFVVMFALRAGEVTVAQTAVLGSLFANALLVLGFVLIAGAIHSSDGIMRFHKRLPNDAATLLLMSVFIIVILGLSDSVGDRASKHEVAISVIGAICLLSLYAFGCGATCVVPILRTMGTRRARTPRCRSRWRSRSSVLQAPPRRSCPNGSSGRSTAQSKRSGSPKRSPDWSSSPSPATRWRTWSASRWRRRARPTLRSPL